MNDFAMNDSAMNDSAVNASAVNRSDVSDSAVNASAGNRSDVSDSDVNEPDAIDGRTGDIAWRPTACLSILRRRAAMLAASRRFFADRGVLEVDTPIVVNAAVTDPHIDSARVHLSQDFSQPSHVSRSMRRDTFFLHTSPEYAMKRLLASGSGDIYQICHVVRASERGPHHNSEFTLIEWYRLGYSLDELMDEVEMLVRHLLGAAAQKLTSERLTYREAFLRHLALDPFSADRSELCAAARDLGFESGAEASRDELLQLLQGALVGPALGRGALTFLRGFPASQAALARLDPQDPQAALRFELYCQGIELANGFQELAAAAEQRGRFEFDNAERKRRGLQTVDIDERLLAALEAGLPDCAGVALGFDRTLMVSAGLARIEAAVPFPLETA